LLYALNFSPDSSQLATASDDATVKVWRVADLFDETEPTLVLPYEFDLPEGSVAFSPDNTLLASSSGSNIFVWNLIASENAEPGELL
jgi:WD40 repeat protein